MLEPKDDFIERFHKGDRVKAIDGPLADRLLVYEGMTGKDRVKVLVEILGRKVQTTIEEKSLVAA